MADGFGNSFSMSRLAGLTRDDVQQRFGNAFLVIQGHAPAALKLEDDATHDTIETVGVGSAPLAMPVRGLVYVVVKKPASTFAWVSVGRHENNDVHMPHGSVSRFHALIREERGVFTIHDAKSANGTTLGGVKVPAHGSGAGAVLTGGALVCFGEVVTRFLDAAGVHALSLRTRSGDAMPGVGRS